ncbi:hypothetical protein NDI39_31510 [Microcoleus sp. ZQ-A2]|nr:hypothetical protein [Microcoleus sp. FACHB-1]
MELSDGSEKLRIKKEIAQKIRREAERLEMSFPEMLYYIVNSYFIGQANLPHQVNQHHQTSPGVLRSRSQQWMEEEEESFELDLDV